MTTEQFVNNATSTLNGGITYNTTTLVVTSAALFPAIAQFRIIVDFEIMLVTGVSGTTFTVERGAENTAAVSHLDVAPVDHILTAGAIGQLQSDFLNIDAIGHRLTLTSNTPVTITDVTGSGTLYLTPYKSNRLTLFDGYVWKQYAVPEISLSLTLTNGKNYDVFVYNNASIITLELSTAWINDTTRADTINQQDGVWVKSSDLTRRYIGTIRASGTNTTEDSVVKRFIWNLYNQENRTLLKSELGAATWSGTSNGSWVVANSSTDNKVEGIIGLSISNLDISLFALMHGSISGDGVGIGVGEDSVTTVDPNCMGLITVSEASLFFKQVSCRLIKTPILGYHSWYWLEQSDHGFSTYSFRTNATNSTGIASGIIGCIKG